MTRSLELIQLLAFFVCNQQSRPSDKNRTPTQYSAEVMVSATELYFIVTCMPTSCNSKDATYECTAASAIAGTAFGCAVWAARKQVFASHAHHRKHVSTHICFYQS
jgi:hypothetical protein